MDIVSRDAVYYRNSGGGVTFSGGEATGAKYAFIGKRYALEPIAVDTQKEEASLLEIFSPLGIAVEIGR